MSLKTLNNAITLLELFKIQNSWGVREIARHLDLNVTVVHRILSTFEEANYLSFNNEAKKYEIGQGLYVLLENLKVPATFRNILFQAMKELVVKSNETIFFTMRSGNEGKSVMIVEGENSIRLKFDIGESRPLHTGASNFVILANVSDEEFNDYISNELVSLTPSTITDKKRLCALREQVIEDGGLITESQATQDVTGIAVPLMDCHDEVIGSLAIAGPSYRTKGQEHEYFDFLLLKNQELREYIQKYKIDKDYIITQFKEELK